MTDTAARLLRLLSLLQANQHWSGAALAGRLQVSTRTVRVDVQRLREVGYDIDATPGLAGGYRLRAGTSLPPLLLDDDEAVAVAVGLRVAATSGIAGISGHTARAVAKLERLLPSRLWHQLDTVNAVAETLPATRDLVTAEVLATVATACDRSEQLRLDYRDRHQGCSYRRVEPHRLVHVADAGTWWPTTSTGTIGEPSG